MPGLANLVRVVSATSGTGTLALGAAVTGFLTPTQAGMTDGAVYSYAIEAAYVTVGDDLVPTAREVGTGTYTASGTTLTRTVINSTNSNALLVLTGDQQVIISFIATSAGDVSILGTTASTSSTTGALTVAGGVGITGKLFVDTPGTSGTITASLLATCTAPSTSDLSAAALSINYTMTAVSATNQLIDRPINYNYLNNLTGGGHVQICRFLGMTAGAVSGAVTDELSYLYISDAGLPGTVGTCYGINISSLPGTTKVGIKDAVTGSTWQHGGTTASTSSTTGALTVAGGVGIDGALYTGGETAIRANTATPAGGSTSARLLLGTTAGFGIYYGSGVPTVSAAAGSIYIRTDNAGASLRLYSNTTGSTTWAAITSA
jgi:hypothetical protein